MRQRRFLRLALPIQLRFFFAIVTVSLYIIRASIKICIIKNFLTIQFFMTQYFMIQFLRGGIILLRLFTAHLYTILIPSFIPLSLL